MQMTIPATFNVLPITDDTTGLEAINMLNDAIRRAWPESESFTYHHTGLDRSTEPYYMARAGHNFFDIIGAGRVIVHCMAGSEGYWVHVDAHERNPENEHFKRVRHIMTLKTYGDLQEAQAITNLTQFLLGG